jgi:xylulokinase
MAIHLGIDIGTSATKTLAIDDSGRILADATSDEYPLYHPRPSWSEQNPEDWWQATQATVRAVMARADAKPADVKAIGLSGQMHGSVFLDDKQRVIRPALLWNDQRTAAECEEIERRAGGREALIRMVANPALTGFTAPKVLWLRNKEPENFAKVRKLLLPKDYIRFRLTGEFATEVSDASGMLLLDVARRRWSSELLAALELDERLLAHCYESHEVTGRLTREAADALGLTTSCVVVGGAGDCAAGAVGNGIVTTGCASTSIGTSGVVFVHSDEVKIDPRGRVHTFCHAVNGKWHMMGVNLSAGGSLQWFRNSLCQSLKSFSSLEGFDAYDLLAQEAVAVPPGSQGLFFLPYLSGERTPHADPHARGCFIGLTLAHRRGHMARAVMEGVTYNLRESLEIFRELKVPITEIRASGGGAKSPLWRQIQADVFGQSVVTLNAEEGPAYGVALLAAVGAGAFPNIQAACQSAIRVVSETGSRPAANEQYERSFTVYRGLYPALKNVFRDISVL